MTSMTGTRGGGDEYKSHYQGDPQRQQRSVLVVGNLTPDQLLRVRDAIAATLAGDVQYVAYPGHNHAASRESDEPAGPEQPASPPDPLEGVVSSKPALMQINTGLDGLCKKLQSVAKLETKMMKAVGAISHYQKQQQELADNFVRLSNKYQELKGNFHTLLWGYMPRLPEFSAIPVLDTHLEENETQVGPFTVGLMVGKGHFAEVRVCSLPGEERRLVIKAIDKQRVKNINGLQRISHEIEALRILRHPHILTLYSVCHGKQHVHLITERLTSDLYEFIGEHSNGVGEGLAKRVISPIVDAVLFMHSKGFCHRDLKPENILLDYIGPASATTCTDFIIKVCDFGLCEKIPEDNSPLTEFCGSPGFMAPEMVIDRQYDGRKADVWSVGCILLELLLTAKEFSTIWMKNFQDEFMEDTSRFKRQLLGSWSQLEIALKPRISEDMFALLCGLLKIDPSQRMSTFDLQRLASRIGLLVVAGTGLGSSSSSSSKGGKTLVAPVVPLQGPREQHVPLAQGLVHHGHAGTSSSAAVDGGYGHHHGGPGVASTLVQAAMGQQQHQYGVPLQHHVVSGYGEAIPGGPHGPSIHAQGSSSKVLGSSASHGPTGSSTSSGAASSKGPGTSSSSSSSTASSRARPVGGKQQQQGQAPGGARNSLRAQTLIKLDANASAGASPQQQQQQQPEVFGRGRNPALGPLSPGTPELGGQQPKKFFSSTAGEEATGQQQPPQQVPGAPSGAGVLLGGGPRSSPQPQQPGVPPSGKSSSAPRSHHLLVASAATGAAVVSSSVSSSSSSLSATSSPRADDKGLFGTVDL